MVTLQAQAPRGLYEMPYRLDGKLVLVAISSAGNYVAHELVSARTCYAAAEARLRALLDEQDPVRRGLVAL